jgi:hypothetical protein
MSVLDRGLRSEPARTRCWAHRRQYLRFGQEVRVKTVKGAKVGKGYAPPGTQPIKTRIPIARGCQINVGYW